jgi:DUF177 domain-containing protein
MLQLDLNTIKTPHERFEKVYTPDQFGPTEDFRIASPVSLAFDIFKDKDQYRLVGDVKSVLELPCSRCLEAFTLPVDQSFDLRYQPHSKNTGEGEREIEEDDLTTAFYTNEAIDLGALIREQFYLALPMKPLCRAECKGLCPQCGANLNTSNCNCRPQWDDPRLAALKALKKES